VIAIKCCHPELDSGSHHKSLLFKSSMRFRIKSGMTEPKN